MRFGLGGWDIPDCWPGFECEAVSKPDLLRAFNRRLCGRNASPPSSGAWVSSVRADRDLRLAPGSHGGVSLGLMGGPINGSPFCASILDEEFGKYWENHLPKNQTTTTTGE